MAAGLAVVAAGGSAALADEAVVDDDIDHSSTSTDQAPAAPEAGADAPAVPESSEPAEPSGDAALTDPVPADDAGTDPAQTQADETAPDASDEVVSLAAVAPDYGTQKIRVGVQIADGSWVADGATLVGTTMQITITGGVDGDGAPLPDEVYVCEIADEVEDPDGTPSAGSCVGPSPEAAYWLDPGQTATVVPLSVPAGIELNDSAPLVTPPCEINGTTCVDSSTIFPDPTPVDFLATGTKPTVAADTGYSTDAGVPITIDVLANDDSGNGAPLSSVTISTAPTGGTAEVIGELPPPAPPAPPLTAQQPAAAVAPAAITVPGPIGGTVQVRYTPTVGFSGLDTFAYSVMTPNGTRTAQVSVMVRAAVPAAPTVPTVPTAPAAPTVTSPVNTASALPQTGGPSAGLLGVGAALVVAGGAALTVRRRQLGTGESVTG